MYVGKFKTLSKQITGRYNMLIRLLNLLNIMRILLYLWSKRSQI